MKGKICFTESPDSFEVPCPFCISLIEVYEEFEKNLPFEFIPLKIDVKQGDERVQIAFEVADKLGKKGELFAPIFVNDGKADVATRGINYFKGKLREVLKKWMLFT